MNWDILLSPYYGTYVLLFLAIVLVIVLIGYALIVLFFTRKQKKDLERGENL